MKKRKYERKIRVSPNILLLHGLQLIVKSYLTSQMCKGVNKESPVLIVLISYCLYHVMHICKI